MKTFSIIPIVLLFLFAGWNGLSAQEFITPMYGNPVARAYHDSPRPIKKINGPSVA